MFVNVILPLEDIAGLTDLIHLLTDNGPHKQSEFIHFRLQPDQKDLTHDDSVFLVSKV